MFIFFSQVTKSRHYELLFINYYYYCINIRYYS